MHAVEMIEMERKDVESLVRFMGGINGITCLPCDDLNEAVEGYMVYYEVDGKEESMHLVWRVGKPLKNIIHVTPENAHGALTMAMDEKCELWDDPKNRLFLFVKYADVESDKESKALGVSLTTLKALPDDLRNRVKEYRDECNRLREAKKRARDEGCMIPHREVTEIMRCPI